MGDEFGEGFAVFTNDVLSGNGIEFGDGFADGFLEEGFVAATGGEAQFDHACHREVSQPNEGGQSEFPRFDEVGQEGFANALYEDVFVQDGSCAEMLLEAGEDTVVHEPFHLEGDTGHGNEHFAATFEPHARGGTKVVVEHLATAGHPSLATVDLSQFITAGFENALHIIEGFFIFVKLAAKVFTEKVLGNVVFGRAEAAREEDGVGGVESLIDSIPDVLPVVAYNLGADNLDAYTCEETCHGGGVGIDNLPNKQFVTYVDYSSFHNAKVRKKKKTERIF